MIGEGPWVRWDHAYLELAIAVAMPYAVFGVLWSSYNRKATKYFAAAATACAVVNVLLSSPCGCTDTRYLIDRALQSFGVAAAVVLFARAVLKWLFSRSAIVQGDDPRPLRKTADGWLVSDKVRFERVVGRPPPRPIAFWSLLRADLSTLGSSAFLITGTLVVLAGILLHDVAVVGTGLCAFWWHGRMMFLFLKDERHGQARIGVIDKLEDMHQALPKVFKATMTCIGGEQFLVGGERRKVKRFLEEDGRVTVTALLTPHSNSGRVLGARRWVESDGGGQPPRKGLPRKGPE